MSDYLVTVDACDGATRSILDLTADEVAVARRIAAAITAESHSGCEPTMRIDRVLTDDEIYRAPEGLVVHSPSARHVAVDGGAYWRRYSWSGPIGPRLTAGVLLQGAPWLIESDRS